MGISLQRSLSRPGWAALVLLAVAMIGLLTALGCASSSQDIGTGPGQASEIVGGGGEQLAPAPEVGRLAPDFTLTDLDGNSVSLSDFRGRVVFINFWATWCPACRVEMPEIEAVHQEYKDKDVVVIGVDIREDEDTVRRYIERGGYSWTFVMDTTGEVTMNYRIIAIPTSFFLDEEGVITAIKTGAITKKSMESRLAEAME